jgi:outer membrane immunogenic protein
VPVRLPAPVLQFRRSFSGAGGAAGGGLGYDWQSAAWVLGVEGDFSWSGIAGHSDVCGMNTIQHSCGTKLENLGMLLARLGYAPGAGNWLIYAAGGFARGELEAWDDLTNASGHSARNGWTAGGGIELQLASNLSAKLEYLYVDLGSAHLFDVVPGIPETVSFKTNLLRLGLNYRFGAGFEASEPAASSPIPTKRVGSRF